MREINYTPPSSSSVFRLGTALLVGLVAIYAVFASWYTVDQGEKAVVLRQVVPEWQSNVHLPRRDPQETSIDRLHQGQAPEALPDSSVEVRVLSLECSHPVSPCVPRDVKDCPIFLTGEPNLPSTAKSP